jgi:hypothetical protein
MNMLGKRLLTVVAAGSLALAAPLASAVDFGIGASFNSDGEGSGGFGVSLPMRFGNMTVEPDLSFYDSSGDRTYPLSPTNNRYYDNRQLTLEVGVYRRQQVIPSVETYLGGRVGYTQYEYSYTYPLSPSSSYSEESSGYYLGPTFGAEYFFNKHFSMGLDVSLLYESTSSDSVDGTFSHDSDRKSLYYQTRARLRAYF